MLYNTYFCYNFIGDDYDEITDIENLSKFSHNNNNGIRG